MPAGQENAAHDARRRQSVDSSWPVRLAIDLHEGTVSVEATGGTRTIPLSDPEAFSLVSWAWLRAGWDVKHVYSFTWMGRPVIQLPEDLVRMQEVLYRLQPDVIVETGIAHGGSLVFYASLCKAYGRGRVIGVDVEIRPHNREALERHELGGMITIIEGNSIDPEVVERVKTLVSRDERVLVSLDSNHTKAHVLAELEAYASLVPVGSYIVAADGIMADLVGAPRSTPDWGWDNPRAAVAEFLVGRDDFVLEPPVPQFNEGAVREAVSYWAGGWLKRAKPGPGAR